MLIEQSINPYYNMDYADRCQRMRGSQSPYKLHSTNGYANTGNGGCLRLNPQLEQSGCTYVSHLVFLKQKSPGGVFLECPCLRSVKTGGKSRLDQPLSVCFYLNVSGTSLGFEVNQTCRPRPFLRSRLTAGSQRAQSREL